MTEILQVNISVFYVNFFSYEIHREKKISYRLNIFSSSFFFSTSFQVEKTILDVKY